DDVADVGDPCNGEGNWACSPDRKQLLSCHQGRFKSDQQCKKGCAYTRDDKTDKTTFDCKYLDLAYLFAIHGLCVTSRKFAHVRASSRLLAQTAASRFRKVAQ